LPIVPPNGFALPAAMLSSRFWRRPAVDPPVRPGHGNALPADCQKP